MSKVTKEIKIISLSGLDGSGKTTQVKMLKKHFENQGGKVFYFHASHFSIANSLAKLLGFKKNNSPKNSKKHNSKSQEIDSGDSVTQASWFSIQLRKIFLIIDIARFKFLLKKLSKKGYTHLLTDRYFYDSLVNIEYLTHNLSKIFFKKKDSENTDDTINDIDFPKNTHTCLVIRIIEKIIPKPNTAFYLSVSPQEIMTRNRIPEQGLTYLQIKYLIFNQKFQQWKLKKVLGNEAVDQVFQTLAKELSV